MQPACLPAFFITAEDADLRNIGLKKAVAAAWPNEPVPPVMSTTLPLSKGSFPDAGGALLTEFMHDSQHLFPSGGNIPGALAKAGRIERAVDHQLPVRHDLDRMPVLAGYAAQQIVLADGRRGDMISPDRSAAGMTKSRITRASSTVGRPEKIARVKPSPGLAGPGTRRPVHAPCRVPVR